MKGRRPGKAPRTVLLVAPTPRQVLRIGAPPPPPSRKPLAEEMLDLPTEIPQRLGSGKIPLDAIAAGVIVQGPLWTSDDPDRGAHKGDIPMARIDGKIVVEGPALTEPLPDPCTVTIPADVFDAYPAGAETAVIIQFEILGMPSEQDYIYLPEPAIVDKQAPGGTRVPPIEFAEDIIQNGLSLAKLLTMPGQVLPGTIANYEFQDTGDAIHLFMRLRPDGDEVEAGVVNVTSREGGIELTFDRATLEKVKGYGVVDFYHYIVDEVGHRSPTSAMTPVRLLIDGAPETIPPPIVPGMDDDDLVTDPEARPVTDILIPAYDPPALAGDYFVVFVGESKITTDALNDDDVGNDPLLSVPFPYALLVAANTTGTDPFDAVVRYDVMRGGIASASEITQGHFDLTLPGGPDPLPEPEPDPDPELPVNPNDALKPPTLRGADGSDNDIPPAESIQDATGVVPRVNIYDVPVFKPADVVQLYIGPDKVGAAHTVTIADLPANLELTVPSAAMLAHPGPGKFYYGIERAISGGQKVVAFSPHQLINIYAEGELPGAGDPLLDATFVDWLNGQGGNPRRSYAIGLNDARGGTPVRIRLGQPNVGEGNTIDWSFQGFNERGEPVSAASMTGTYTIVAADTVPKTDASLPKPPPPAPVPAQRAYVDIIVPENVILQIVYGSATFDYTITNRFGSGKATQDNVLVDVRQG